MTRERFTCEDIARLALDELAGDERREAEAHVGRCDACAHELTLLRGVARDLALLGDAAEPPADLGRKIRERLQGTQRTARNAPPVQAWKAWSATPGVAGGFATIKHGEGTWEPTAIDGIETRRLFVDAERSRVTMLVRMAPGTAYPPHVHADLEECYVLEGDLQVGDDCVLEAGDYQRAEAGSRHDVQATENGCVLLLVSGLADELEEHPAR